MTIGTLFQTIYWVWVASEILTVLLTRTRRSSGETRDRGSILVLWAVIFCSIWAAMQSQGSTPQACIQAAGTAYAECPNWCAPCLPFIPRYALLRPDCPSKHTPSCMVSGNWSSSHPQAFGAVNSANQDSRNLKWPDDTFSHIEYSDSRAGQGKKPRPK